MGIDFALGILLGAVLNFGVLMREFRRRQQAEAERDVAARLLQEAISGRKS